MALGYVTFPAVTGNHLTVPDAAPLDVPGDLCIVALIAPNDWTPAASVAICAKWTSPSNAYMLRLITGGALSLSWSPDGTSTLSASSTVIVPSVVDGDWKWIAVTFDVDNGATGRSVRFWTGTDGTTWTQVGATVTTATVTSIFNGATPLFIGAQANATALFPGSIAHISIRNGIGAAGVVGGSEVFRYDGPTDLIGVAAAATSFAAGTGQTVTVNRAGGGSQTLLVPPLWGSIAVTEDADTMAAAGGSTHTGTVAWTEADDTMAAAGASTHIGTVAWTEDDDTMGADGVAGTPKNAVIAWTEADDTMAAVGSGGRVATLAWVETDDTMAAAGTSGRVGTIAWTEDDDTMAAVGTVGHVGTIAWTEDDDTMAGEGRPGYPPTGGTSTGGRVTTNSSIGDITANSSTGAISTATSTGTILPREAAYV